MGRFAKVWARIKEDRAARIAVCVELQEGKTAAEEKLPDAEDLAALGEMETLFPEAEAAPTNL